MALPPNETQLYAQLRPKSSQNYDVTHNIFIMDLGPLDRHFTYFLTLQEIEENYNTFTISPEINAIAPFP
jgi:hypothetical protein